MYKAATGGQTPIAVPTRNLPKSIPPSPSAVALQVIVLILLGMPTL